MILAIDIGNTNIVVGCIEEEKIYFIERISTNHDQDRTGVCDRPQDDP